MLKYENVRIPRKGVSDDAYDWIKEFFESEVCTWTDAYQYMREFTDICISEDVYIGIIFILYAEGHIHQNFVDEMLEQIRS